MKELKEIFNFDSGVIGQKPTENVYPLYISIDSPNHRLCFFVSTRDKFKEYIEAILHIENVMSYYCARSFGYSNQRVCVTEDDAVFHHPIAFRIEWLKRLFSLLNQIGMDGTESNLLFKAEEMQIEDFMDEIDNFVSFHILPQSDRRGN